VTVLDLQPDWSVAKIFPPDKDSELVDPGGNVEVPLVFELPSAYKESLETIKVFATVGSTSFDWLQLPPLDKPLVSRGAKRSSGNALENLMAEFSADAPPANATRARLGNVAMAKWTTAQADVLVRRRPPAIKHVRDASTSLLQSAFEEASAARGSGTARGAGTAPSAGTRSSVSDPLDNAITSYFADPTDLPDAVSRPREGTTRGAWDTVKYCAALAKGMAGELWNAKMLGDDKKYNEYKEALTAKFGDCDPRFTEALKQYMEFLARHGKVPYRRWKTLSDSVIEGKLPANAVIGLVADWATGQPEALEVLRQVKQQKPDVAIHLGDIYYAGTATEVDSYFYQPWQNILKPDSSNITSLTLPGNHDLYAGGQPFYDLLDKLKQPASYFCLRNADWQLIGLDTALNDKLSGAPTSLDPSELEWLRDKITNSGNRRTVLLSHHQLFSTNDKFGDEKKSHNPALLQQMSDLLPKVDLWLWGHEHDLVVFEAYLGLSRGRCIGGSAFPVGKYEMPQAPSNPEVPYNKQVVLSKAGAFYQHCYAVMRLNGRSAIVDYYEDSDGGRRLFSESI
jgi:predicted phosphodiesterase